MSLNIFIGGRAFGKVAAMNRYIKELEAELKEAREERARVEFPLFIHTMYLTNPRVRLVITQEIQRNRGVGKIPMPVFSRMVAEELAPEELGDAEEDPEPARGTPVHYSAIDEHARFNAYLNRTTNSLQQIKEKKGNVG